MLVRGRGSGKSLGVGGRTLEKVKVFKLPPVRTDDDGEERERARVTSRHEGGKAVEADDSEGWGQIDLFPVISRVQVGLYVRT